MSSNTSAASESTEQLSSLSLDLDTGTPAEELPNVELPAVHVNGQCEIAMSLEDAATPPSPWRAQVIYEEDAGECTATEESSPSSLCGWLHKTGRSQAAPKLRWFVYVESKGCLEYYRAAQDPIPLGSIDIATAAFTVFPDKVEANCLEIVTGDKNYRLYHKDTPTLLYWRQELMLRRHQLDTARSSQLHELTSHVTQTVAVEQQNLVESPGDRVEATDPIAIASMADKPGPQLGHSPIDQGEAQVGEQTRSTQRPTLIDLSLKNLAIEVRNRWPSDGSSRSTNAHRESMSTFVDSPTTRQAPQRPSVPPLLIATQKSMSPSTPTVTSPHAPVLRHQRSFSFMGDLFRTRRHGDQSTDCHNCSQLRLANRELTERVDAQEFQLQSWKQVLRNLARGETGRSPPAGNESSENTGRGDLLSVLDAVRQDNDTLRASVAMLTETVLSKDELLVRAVSDADTWRREANDHRERLSALADSAASLARLCSERDKLILVNRFMESEVGNLRRLWESAVQQQQILERTLRQLCGLFEQQNQAYRSCFRSLLVETEDASRLNSSQCIDQMRRLLDLIESVDSSFRRLLTTVEKETDEYGFFTRKDVDQLIENIQVVKFVEQGSAYLLDPDMTESDRARTDRWQRCQSHLQFTPFRKMPQLKVLLRQGIPIAFRPEVWEKLILSYIDQYRSQRNGEQYFRELIDRIRARPFCPDLRQIELDLFRGLVDNTYYSRPSVDTGGCHGVQRVSKVDQLRNVLMAFTEECQDRIGYCQGLDRIAAVLLLVLNNEEMAFWALTTIVRCLRPIDYYSAELRDALVDQRVLKQLIEEYMPAVHNKLKALAVDILPFTFKWFITLFINGFHWKIYMRLLDAFLFEGDKVVFRYALAVLLYLEPLILQQQDTIGLMAILRNLGDFVRDPDRLSDLAFTHLRHFSKRRIAAKRRVFRAEVDAEMAVLMKQREDRRTEQQLLMNKGTAIGRGSFDILLPVEDEDEEDEDNEEMPEDEVTPTVTD